MLGVLYLILAWWLGYNALKLILPQVFVISEGNSFFGKPMRLPRWMIVAPASFIVGTLTTTWVAYFLCYAFYRTDKPLLYGNLIAFILFLTASGYFLFLHKTRIKQYYSSLKNVDIPRRCLGFLNEHKLELIFILIATVVWGFLMFHSFRIIGDVMSVGGSVYSDWIQHLAVFRSFSHGHNFPTEFPLFPDGTMRYHFMFHYLAGNLEYLGLRLDLAFNICSILAFTGFLMLLYALAVKITGKRWAGIITAVMFFFRSSFAIFTFAASRMGSFSQLITIILCNTNHIGRTPKEEWGLWAQKTFVNQRHYPFALGMLMLILILFLPLVKKMVERLQEVKGKGFLAVLKEFFLSEDAWAPEKISRSLVIGVILGLFSFWNGAMVIGALTLLGVIALFSKHRLEYLNVAILTYVIASLFSIFFVGPTGSLINPRISIGFLAERKDLIGILSYYIELFGILPFMIMIGLFFTPKGSRLLALAFVAPWVMATTVELTGDVVVNHKYVFISVMLLNIFVAYFICNLFSGAFTRKFRFGESKKAAAGSPVAFNAAIDLDSGLLESGKVDFNTYYPITGWLRVSGTETATGKLDVDFNLKADFGHGTEAISLGDKPAQIESRKNTRGLFPRLLAKILAVLLLIAMTVTGVVDLITLYNMDRGWYASFNIKKDQLLLWVEKNTHPKDVFLMDPETQHSPISLAGRKIFMGYAYFAWSAGYVTYGRENIIREIYSGINLNRVKELLKENNIKYIVIDERNRTNRSYLLNEQFFADNFREVGRFKYFDELNHCYIEVQKEDDDFKHLVIYKVE